MARECLQQLDVVESALGTANGSCLSPVPINVVEVPIPSVSPSISGSSLEVIRSDPFAESIDKLPLDEQLDLISDCFSTHASRYYGLSVPKDFVKLSLCAMRRLKDVGKLNVIYGLAMGIGTEPPDGSDSCFPTTRMPFGLLQYMVQFFITEPGHQVSVVTSVSICNYFLGLASASPTWLIIPSLPSTCLLSACITHALSVTHGI